MSVTTGAVELGASGAGSAAGAATGAGSGEGLGSAVATTGVVAGSGTPSAALAAETVPRKSMAETVHTAAALFMKREALMRVSFLSRWEHQRY
ncbi:MAG: hypothetical protein JWO99_315 [Candidatus Saccharibacteria bacterium]|nr:hypothetical protein [Candidatus Saccharibacteria bacterium]